MLVAFALSLLAAWSFWSCITLFQNYRIARQIGLPIVIEPINSLSYSWIAFSQFVRGVPALSKARSILANKLMRLSYFGWQFDQGYDIHAEIGPLFTLVTPGSLIVVVADADIAHNIHTKRKDFIKPDQLYRVQNVFGPHILSAEGKVWQRHRRLIAPSFNEKSSSSVWHESVQQTRDMLKLWKMSTTGISTTVLDTTTVGLNVLTGCVFGIMQKFGEEHPELKADGQLSYRDAIMIVVKRFPILLVLPEKYLCLPFMPSAVRLLGRACKEFRAHVNTMLIRERESKNGVHANLLTNLIRASEAEKANKESIGLTDEELLGNMFVFTVAGHETTANTAATAIVYLARYPKYQAWLREELQHVLKDQENVQLAYSTSFPRLKRCLAIMLETLRVHGPVTNIVKSTNDQPQVVHLKGSPYTIPRNTIVFVNIHAIHVDPGIWANDADQWRPERWITRPSGQNLDPGCLFDSEAIYRPPSGAFAPWSEGPRICPGKKFSQVEFVAILAQLLLKHEVAPILQGGRDETNTMLDEMLSDSATLPITLQMKQPEKVKFVWKSLEAETQRRGG